MCFHRFSASSPLSYLFGSIPSFFVFPFVFFVLFSCDCRSFFSCHLFLLLSIRFQRSPSLLSSPPPLLVPSFGATVQAVHSLVKMGASESIRDLAAFRESNLLNFNTFYTGEFRVNYMGRLVVDDNARVRTRFYLMLSDWMLHLPERFDYGALSLCAILRSFLSLSMHLSFNMLIDLSIFRARSLCSLSPFVLSLSPPHIFFGSLLTAINIQKH